MRILSIGNFTTGWDGSICDEEHIAQALEDLGHAVHRLSRDSLIGYKDEHLQADLTLIAQYDGYPEDLWQYLPRPLVYWAFDYQADGQPWHEHLVATSDLYLSKRVADSKYPNWQWLSQDFAPDFLDKYSGDIPVDIEVLFTGSYLPWATERNETLKAVDQNFNLTIHSVTPDAWKVEGFKNVLGPVMDHELPRLIARTRINLSIDHTLEAGYWSDRNAQIMACCGFVLFRYIPLSETVFRDNVAYFYSIEDCLRKIEEYGNSMKRITTQVNGYHYARKNLMVMNRVKDLLTIVGSIK